MRISYWSSYVCSSDLDVNKYIRAAMMAVAATAAAPAAAQVPAQLPDYYPPSYEKIVEGSKSEGHLLIYLNLSRSEERRVGKECVRMCTLRGSAAQQTKHRPH